MISITPQPWFKYFITVFTILFGWAAVAACQPSPRTTEPDLQPSSTPTLNFADLPPVIAAAPNDQTATPVPLHLVGEKATCLEYDCKKEQASILEFRLYSED